ncbi:penicillin-insensitive murein endopeptidase [Myxococcota bacterium]|nr:penicillin-insensitive murein endopeptidase [Myxococcota bacterium]
MCALPSILLALLLLVTPGVSSSAPRGCTIKNGRIACKIKGKKKIRRRNPKASTPLWPLHKIRRSRTIQSVGLPFRGMLHRGRPIPLRGSGYIVVPRTISRGHFYGTRELIDLIRRSARRVWKAYPKSRLTVGDLSGRRGGRINGHRSHQSGRDVDIGFYLVDRRNKYKVARNWFVGIDPRAIGKGANSHLMFDLERNWELVEALITDKSRVELILIAGYLKNLLINYAEAVLRPPRVIKRAKAILKHYPHHDDHYHIRISCPAGHFWCNK